jgi:hypothetical protein
MIRIIKTVAVSLGLFMPWTCGAVLCAQPATSAIGWRVISGVVSSTKDGQNLDDADVTLSRKSDHQAIAETKTDSAGRFAFTGLANGKYLLRASHRGYIPAAFQEHHGFFTAVVTGEDLVSTDLQLELEPQPALYGVVADESGDPVPRAHVSLYRKDPISGSGLMIRAGATECDELGNFEFSHLDSGTYYIAFFGTPWYAVRPQVSRDSQGRSVEDRRSYALDVAYPVTYYPDTTDAASAAPVQLNAGDRTQLNLTLHAVHAVHLSIQIPGSGRDQSAFSPQLRQDVFGFSDSAQSVNFYTSIRNPNAANPNTTIDVAGVAPGRYDLELRSPTGTSSRLSNINAASDQVNIDASPAMALVDVSGTVVQDRFEVMPSSLTVRLTSQQESEPSVGQIEADGTFHLHAVRPGTYEVSVTANGIAVPLTQLTAKGGSVNGHLLKVGSEPIELRASVTESSASIRGFAELDGRPASGAFILLVPDDPSAGLEAWRPNQSDSDGSFEFTHVLAGQYTLLAITEGWKLDWAHPNVIDRYVQNGAKVAVPLHGSEIILRASVGVQAK